MLTDSNTPDESTESKGSGTKKFLAVLTLVLLAAVGIRFYLIYRERQEAAKPAEAAAAPNYKADDMILPRRLHQMDMGDARQLNGKPLWVFAGGQLNVFPATPTKMDYAHPGPLLLGAEPIQVVNFIEGKAPESAFSRIPKGDGQVFMLFHKVSDPTRLYGTPVGYKDGKVYTFYIDECFFYDDPHTLYKHWGTDTWKAIDEHRVVKGMNELQTNLALGQVAKPGPGAIGDRTVTYDNDGKPVTVTYAHNKVVSIS